MRVLTIATLAAAAIGAQASRAVAPGRTLAMIEQSEDTEVMPNQDTDVELTYTTGVVDEGNEDVSVEEPVAVIDGDDVAVEEEIPEEAIFATEYNDDVDGTEVVYLDDEVDGDALTEAGAVGDEEVFFDDEVDGDAFLYAGAAAAAGEYGDVEGAGYGEVEGADGSGVEGAGYGDVEDAGYGDVEGADGSGVEGAGYGEPSHEWDAFRGYGDPNNVDIEGAYAGLIDCYWC